MAEGQSNLWLNDEKKIEENVIYQNTRAVLSIDDFFERLRFNSTSNYLFEKSIEPFQH